MPALEKLIDCSAWTGNWPFRQLRYSNLEKLEAKLKSENVQKSYVSQIETLFQEDPLTVNEALFKATEGSKLFSPVPVVDLSFPNWRETIEAYASNNAVKIIKLAPNYHMYDLSEEMLGALVELTAKAKLLVAIQMRVMDERGHHPLMKVPPVELATLMKTLSRFPKQNFILNNLYFWEIGALGDILENVYFDIAMAEPSEPLKAIKAQASLDKALFSSHCPFLFPEANLNKLKCSSLPKEDVDKIAFATIEKLAR